MHRLKQATFQIRVNSLNCYKIFMVNFRDIQTYWNNKQPGRKIAKNFTENNNPKRFFELIDNYRFHRNNYQYLINGDFFNHSDYDGKDILEIGCGLGADLQKFAESFEMNSLLSI